MDFIGQIGERYLMGKANAAPQQFENLVKKQFKGGAEEPGAGGGGKAAGAAAIAATGQEEARPSRTRSTEKDEEIARLRQQLAQSKLEKGAATHATKKSSATGKAVGKTEDLAALGSGAGIKKGLGGKKQLEAPKDMKGLKALGAGAAASTGPKGKRQLETSGSRRSTAESGAARKGSSVLGSGTGKSKSEKQAEGLAVLAGLGTGAGSSNAGRSGKNHGSEVFSVGRRHSVSSTQQDTASVASSCHTARPRRSKSVKQPSKAGSEAQGMAPSRRPQKQLSEHESVAPSISASRKSTKGAIEYGSKPPSPSPSRATAGHGHRRGVNGYVEVEVEESRSLVPYDSRRNRAESEAEEEELYIIEVEEDLLPRRKKSTKERSSRVVEISHSEGRTVYMVK